MGNDCVWTGLDEFISYASERFQAVQDGKYLELMCHVEGKKSDNVGAIIFKLSYSIIDDRDGKRYTEDGRIPPDENEAIESIVKNNLEFMGRRIYEKGLKEIEYNGETTFVLKIEKVNEDSSVVQRSLDFRE